MFVNLFGCFSAFSEYVEIQLNIMLRPRTYSTLPIPYELSQYILSLLDRNSLLKFRATCVANSLCLSKTALKCLRIGTDSTAKKNEERSKYGVTILDFLRVRRLEILKHVDIWTFLIPASALSYNVFISDVWWLKDIYGHGLVEAICGCLVITREVESNRSLQTRVREGYRELILMVAEQDRADSIDELIYGSEECGEEYYDPDLLVFAEDAIVVYGAVNCFYELSRVSPFDCDLSPLLLERIALLPLEQLKLLKGYYEDSNNMDLKVVLTHSIRSRMVELKKTTVVIPVHKRRALVTAGRGKKTTVVIPVHKRRGKK